jgi:hypothetical protein
MISNAFSTPLIYFHWYMTVKAYNKRSDERLIAVQVGIMSAVQTTIGALVQAVSSK